MEYRVTPKYLEELNIGDKFFTPSRTVTEADIVHYAALSGDYNPIHTDDEFAKTTPFGKKLVHGPLTTAISIGLLFRMGLLDRNSLALLNLDTKFMKPVFAGDTLRCVIEVIDKRDTRRPERGVLTMLISTYNQKNEVVMEARQVEMHARRPQ
ncbi:MAG: MaoC family dehydratase N-terminal domain-containing protein [Chloroflexi bacterium]|nr:MaoC family dehydratase N-terminal domain-containing protein [Chloroflexota bacterium]